MNERPNSAHAGGQCSVCGKKFGSHDLRDARNVRPAVWQLIKADHPKWDEQSYICKPDLGVYRRRHVENLLENERGEISQLDQQVLDSLEQGSILARNPMDIPQGQLTVGERMADGLAAFGGSWRFITIFALVLAQHHRLAISAIWCLSVYSSQLGAVLPRRYSSTGDHDEPKTKRCARPTNRRE